VADVEKRQEPPRDVYRAVSYYRGVLDEARGAFPLHYRLHDRGDEGDHGLFWLVQTLLDYDAIEQGNHEVRQGQQSGRLILCGAFTTFSSYPCVYSEAVLKLLRLA
jgi:hypothetical protein